MTNPLAVTVTALIISPAVSVIAVSFLNRPTATPASGNLLLLLRIACFSIVPIITYALLVTGYSVVMGTLTPINALQSLTTLISTISDVLRGLTSPTDNLTEPPGP